MQLGLQLGYWGQLPSPDWVERAVAAEELEFTSVWTAEAWGSDALTPLAFLAARTSRIQLGTSVMQLAARTPTATAMSAITLDHLSGGRFRLGLGVSGPQVVEGWYGRPSNKPLARTREYVEIIRQVLAREEPLNYQGEFHQHPYSGPGSVGLGKPLKSIVHPLRRDIPIYLGAEGPKNVTQTAEIADGWLPLYYSPYRQEVYADQLVSAADDFEVAAIAAFIVTADDKPETIEESLSMTRAMLAFYIGGMGAKGQNYHTKLAARMGLGEQAEKIQEMFLEGKGDQAVNEVPVSFADEISLVGTPARIADRLAAWKESAVTEILIHAGSVDELRQAAELVLPA
ncbi:MAG TPA: LLM class F420-dependent oxidoreductase [Microthrixaceae bacterium]|nr:LLM class F420-dependent oxidoreductase [Microthrixaceae bacterium]